jgi:hypothetical protein
MAYVLQVVCIMLYAFGQEEMEMSPKSQVQIDHCMLRTINVVHNMESRGTESVSLTN